MTDPKGNTTTWGRDLQSREVTKTYADGTTRTTTYETTTSRVKSVRDALNQSKQYTYANDDQLLNITYVNPVNPTPAVTFAYDAFFPRVTSMMDGSGTTVYTYNAGGGLGALRLAQEDGSYSNDTIGYQYDALGRLTTRTVDSSSEMFGYDALNRWLNHSNPLGTFAQTYLGETTQLTGRHRANSVLGVDFTYGDNNHDRRLLGINNNGSRNYTYVTTPENLISRIQDAGLGQTQTWNYSYDNADRLQTAQAISAPSYAYAYDPADNFTAITTPLGTTNYTANNLNQVVAANGLPYSYDVNGNLTADGARTYAWDAENRLLKINYPAQPARNTQFRYDGRSRRVAIISNNGTTTTESRYLWCGESLCQSRTANDVVTRRYYAEGEARPVDNTLLYYSRDHLGSVRNALNVQTGSSVAFFDYDAYGKPTQTYAQLTTDFRYAGMFYLQEAGLYLTHYRVYDPTNGRWLARDPIEEQGGTNVYAYVGNNPLRWVDPLGLKVTLYGRPVKLNGLASILNGTGLDHRWIKTDTREAGMARKGGDVPGQGNNKDWPGVPVEIVDHSGQSGQPGAIPLPYPHPVDEQCVDDQLLPGTDLGRFIPGMNDCHTFTKDVLDKCRTDK